MQGEHAAGRSARPAFRAQRDDRHPHHGANIKETEAKLSYDLFYLKNRSLLLDLFIMLQTLRVLVTAKGT